MIPRAEHTYDLLKKLLIKTFKLLNHSILQGVLRHMIALVQQGVRLHASQFPRVLKEVFFHQKIVNDMALALALAPINWMMQLEPPVFKPMMFCYIICYSSQIFDE